MKTYQWIIMIVMAVIALFALGIAIQAFLYAFIKRKDENSKKIVIKTFANSFVIIIILQAVQGIIKLLNYQWWNNLIQRIYIEPVILSFIIFGIVLMTNKKRTLTPNK